MSNIDPVDCVAVGKKQGNSKGVTEFRRQQTLLKTGALQDAIFNSANFSSIATDAKGVIQIFNVGAERMLGYTAAEVMNKITPADISDPQEVVQRAAALSIELGTSITPGFEALVFKASRGIEDIYELSYIRKDGSRFPAIVSVTALRDPQDQIIGYLLIGTDNTARKEVEAAQELLDQQLRDQQFYTRSLIESNIDALMTTDPQGTISDVNHEMILLTGRTRDELIGAPCNNFFTDPERADAAIKRVLTENKVSDYELTVRAKNGKETEVSYNAATFYDRDRKLQGVFAAARDVTERKKAEDALQLASQYSRSLIEASLDPLVTISAEGKITDVNTATEKVTGLSRSDLVGSDFANYFTDPEQARAGYLQVFAQGFVTDYPLAIRHLSGKITDVLYNASIYRDDAGKVLGVFAAARDVTERKKAEDALQLASQYSRSLIEASLDPLVTISAEGKITDVNTATEKVTGLLRSDLVGSDFANYFTDPEQARAGYLQVFAKGFVTDYPLAIRHLSGKITDVLYNASIYRDDAGKVLGVFAAARDVTERKRFERALEEKNIQLEHASRMKTEFLATMSHELRTPLNAIIGFSEALKDGLMGPMSETQQEYIGDIFTSGQHLLSLINDILDLSKVEAGMMALELEPVDLNSLLSNSLSIVREKAATQRIQLQLDAADDLDVVQLDMRKTKQIVYNLLANAVKFSASGGCVTLRARRVLRSAVGTLPGPWPVHSFPLADNDYREFIEICVSDEGIGILREDMAKLFQAFSQIDSSLARKFEGTGLGLAMVKQMAQLHGGTVAVASEVGEGARFAVWLPLLTPFAEAIGTVAEVAIEPGERKVLVIESDDPSADLLRLLLEAEGFVVQRVASPEEALLLEPQLVPSLITLGLGLPDIDGWELLQRLRERSTLATVPVVIVAGSAGHEFAVPGGAATVLQKPISRAQLKEALTHLGLDSAHDRVHTVLVVDDDPKAVEVIAAFLPAPAYAVVRAYGGSEAITLAQRLKPDLILLDLMMPDVSGFDVLDALSHDPKTQHIPILIVTAKQVTAQERAALNGTAKKMVHVIEKSEFNQARFIAEVGRALLPP
jgi:PAS domain S-box-containing protein